MVRFSPYGNHISEASLHISRVCVLFLVGREILTQVNWHQKWHSYSFTTLFVVLSFVINNWNITFPQMVRSASVIPDSVCVCCCGFRWLMQLAECGNEFKRCFWLFRIWDSLHSQDDSLKCVVRKMRREKKRNEYDRSSSLFNLKTIFCDLLGLDNCRVHANAPPISHSLSGAIASEHIYPLAIHFELV